MIGQGAVPSHLHVTVEATGEQATFLPHYFSTSCFHKRHLQCKGVCKFCPEKCRCDCHKGESSTPKDRDVDELLDSLADVPPSEQAEFLQELRRAES